MIVYMYIHKKESSTLSNCFIQLPLNGMGYAKCKGCGCKLVIGPSHRMHAHVKCIYIYMMYEYRIVGYLAEVYIGELAVLFDAAKINQNFT